MRSSIITTDRDFEALCRRMASADTIAFDTEFVSEHTYRPQLCLVQVAFNDEFLCIDPLTISSMHPLWEAIAAEGHETIVHAGRQEVLFCLDAVGKPPAGLVDVQIAAGLIGLEYPAGYGNLISRLLGVRPDKGETRTDWRRRPLSDRQIHYALEDVRHLKPLRDTILSRIEALGRQSWFADEMASWLTEVNESRGRDRWRRVTGSSGLSARSQAVVRELWLWREREAERRDCPPRQVLRDDLIVELAKRRSADPRQILAIRGMERGDLKRAAPELAQVIDRALKLEEVECPPTIRTDTNPQLNLLGQFLTAALASICRSQEVAPSLVGTANDVRELLAWRLGNSDLKFDEIPALGRGWRAEVVGQLLEDLLAGTVAIRIQDPLSDHPLVFEPASGQGLKNTEAP